MQHLPKRLRHKLRIFVAQERKFCVGQFAGAHGVRGLVKLRSFTAEPQAVFDYQPLSDESGARIYKVTFKSAAGDHLIVTVEGITSKEEADELRGDRLYVPRKVLPPTGKSEFYESDLLGLHAFDAGGRAYGKVMGIHDHGAGVFLEIGSSKKDSFMLPFKDAFVPKVEIEDGKVLVVVPEGWLAKAKPEDDEDQA
jgi:16S rRNA processing protein RimM